MNVNIYYLTLNIKKRLNMANKGVPLTEVITGRVTKTQKDKIHKHGFNIRDAIDFYITVLEDPQQKLTHRRDILINEIRTLEHELQAKKDELEEITTILNGNTKEEAKYSFEVIAAGNNIISNYQTLNKHLDNGIFNYMDSKQGKRVLEAQTVMYKVSDKELFKKELIEYIKECIH